MITSPEDVKMRFELASENEPGSGPIDLMMAFSQRERRLASGDALCLSMTRKENSVKITVHGAGGGEVTGSAYLVQTRNANVLVDFGMFQGGRNTENLNRLPKSSAF